MSGLNEVLAVYLMATKLGIIKMATKLGLIKMATKLGIINQEWIQNAQKQNVHKKTLNVTNLPKRRHPNIKTPKITKRPNSMK